MGRAATNIDYIANATTRCSRVGKRVLGLLKSCAVTACRSGWHVAAFVVDEEARRYVFSSVPSAQTTSFAHASLRHFDATNDLCALLQDVPDARTALAYKSLTASMHGRVLPVGLGGGDVAAFPLPTVKTSGGGGGGEESEDDDDSRRGAIALSVISTKVTRITSSQRRACSLLKNALIIAHLARWQVLVIVQDETGRRLVTADGITTPLSDFVTKCTNAFRVEHDIYYETASLKDAQVLLCIDDILTVNRGRAIDFLPPAVVVPTAIVPVVSSAVVPAVVQAPTKKRKAAPVENDDKVTSTSKKQHVAAAAPQRVVLVLDQQPPGQNYVPPSRAPPLRAARATAPRIIAVTVPGSRLPSRRLPLALLLRTPPREHTISYALDVHELPQVRVPTMKMPLMNRLVQMCLGGDVAAAAFSLPVARTANDDMLDEMLGEVTNECA